MVADEIHVARRRFPQDAAEIFAALEDPHAHVARLPETEGVLRYECEYASGPARGEGAVYEVRTYRRGRRRPQKGRVTVTAHDRPRLVEFTGDVGMSTRFELEPDAAGGTLVTCSRIYRGAHPSRVLNRVVKPETVVESLERDLRRLAESLDDDARNLSELD